MSDICLYSDKQYGQHRPHPAGTKCVEQCAIERRENKDGSDNDGVGRAENLDGEAGDAPEENGKPDGGKAKAKGRWGKRR